MVQFHYLLTDMLEPGERPFPINVPLVRLFPYEFSVRHRGDTPPSMMLDGIEYPYSYLIDGIPPEEHHIRIESVHGRWFYTVWAGKDARELTACAGYLYLTESLTRGRTLPRFRDISTPKLIEHLDAIIAIPKWGCGDALQVLETGLKDSRWKRMLDPMTLDALIQYLRGWKVEDALRQRVTDVIRGLERVQK